MPVRRCTVGCKARRPKNRIVRSPSDISLYVCVSLRAGRAGEYSPYQSADRQSRSPKALKLFEIPERAKGGGDGGIRTLDRPLQAYNGLANRRLQPLGHVSVTGRYARRGG